MLCYEIHFESVSTYFMFKCQKTCTRQCGIPTDSHLAGWPREIHCSDWRNTFLLLKAHYSKTCHAPEISSKFRAFSPWESKSWETNSKCSRFNTLMSVYLTETRTTMKVHHCLRQFVLHTLIKKQSKKRREYNSVSFFYGLSSARTIFYTVLWVVYFFTKCEEWRHSRIS